MNYHINKAINFDDARNLTNNSIVELEDDMDDNEYDLVVTFFYLIFNF